MHRVKVYKERSSWYAECHLCGAIHRTINWRAAIAMAAYHLDLKSKYA